MQSKIDCMPPFPVTSPNNNRLGANSTGSVPAFSRIDTVCAILCAMIPAGIVIGTVVFEFFVCLAGVLWMGQCAVNRRNPLRELKTDWIFIALLSFTLSIYLSVGINGPGDKGLLNDLAFLRFFIFAAALIDVSKRVRIEKYLVIGLLSAVALGAINTIAAYALGFDLLGKPLSRYAAKGNEALRIAGVCAYAGSFFLGWAVLDRKLEIKNKAIILSAFFISVPLVCKTDIRSLYISMTIAVLWVLFLYTKNRISKILALILIIAAIGASVTVVASGKIYLSSFWDRIHIWKVNYATWKEHPLVGVGPFAYRSAYKRTVDNAEPGTFAFEAPDGTIYNHPEVTFHSHSLFMMLLTTTGLLGIISFFGIIYMCLRRIFNRIIGWRYGLVTWPVVLLSVGVTGYNIFDPWYQSLFVFYLVMIGTSAGQPVIPAADILDIRIKKSQPETHQ